MSPRRILFWAHLAVGVSVGLLILFLSVTGLLLTYERQITAFAEDRAYSVAADGRDPLSVDDLATAARDALGNQASLVFGSDPDGPIKATAGRSDQVFLDPYTGAVLGSGVAGVDGFFSTVTHLHRWFALDGDARTIGRAIIDAANLGFLFILVSGLVLWWPKRWRWPLLKTHLVFRRGLPTAKARDYNWHHVFGIWALLPLMLIVVSGVVFSYGWANSLVFALYGEEAPQGRGGPPAGAGPKADTGARQSAVTDPVSLDAVLNAVKAIEPGWRTITLALPQASAPVAHATIDTGNGVQAARKTDVTISRADASIDGFSGDQATPGRQARGWLRFIHTGEIYGVIGQTIAGLASLAAIFLVWTGLSLAWRRLIWPIVRKKPVPIATRAAR